MMLVELAPQKPFHDTQREDKVRERKGVVIKSGFGGRGV